MILGFCSEVDETCALLGYYAASSGNLLTILGPVGCPETSIRNYHYLLHNKPAACSSHPHIIEVKNAWIYTSVFLFVLN
jgi:hypothetical protein